MPEEGDVINYCYLWRHEHADGEEDGRKDRPCLVIVSEQRGESRRIIVAPITSQNFADATSLKVPPPFITQLGLKPGSAIVASDLNAFNWVSPDVRMRGKKHTHYGRLSSSLTDSVLAAAQKLGSRPTARTI